VVTGALPLPPPELAGDEEPLVEDVTGEDE
jgi:hypothetical protein